jgi:hypothetical protein
MRHAETYPNTFYGCSNWICVDIVWYLAVKLSIQCPEIEYLFWPWGLRHLVILVSAPVIFLGSIKTTFAYSIFFTDAIWVEWLSAAFVSSSRVNFNLAQGNQMLNYKNPSLGSTSLVYILYHFNQFERHASHPIFWLSQILNLLKSHPFI